MRQLLPRFCVWWHPCQMNEDDVYITYKGVGQYEEDVQDSAFSSLAGSGGCRICPQADDGAFFDGAEDFSADSHPDGVCGDAAVYPKRVDAAGACMAD